MQLGKIIGEVVATHKVEGLADFKLALVEEVNEELAGSGKKIVAVDIMNAGVGEIVMYVSGSSARATRETDKKPVDHCVIGIIDIITCGNRTTYRKD